LAEVVEWVAVAARPETLLALIRDYSQRHRFLPEGWRYLRPLSETTAGVGAQIEIEARIGPAATTHVVQLHSEGEDFIDEGPPGGENYMTQWTVQAKGEDDFEDGGHPHAPAKGRLKAGINGGNGLAMQREDGKRLAIVQVEMRFEYGGPVGEFFARRRLRRALRDMLRRLKGIAEAR
jgi:hypothetical protein